MSLITCSLETLARRNAGAGISSTQQPSAPYAAPHTVSTAADGVDVEAAIWAQVRVKPDAGTVTFTVRGMSIGATEYESINNAVELEAGAGGWKDVFRVATEKALAVEIVSMSGGATSVDVIIAPALGA